MGAHLFGVWEVLVYDLRGGKSMSMKKRIVSFLLAGAVLLTSAEGSYQWNTVSAASQIRVSRTNVTIAKGAKVTVKAKNTGSRKIKAKISDRRII